MAEPRADAPLLISWGELVWDLFPDGPRLGGAAANVAFHAAQLGARSLLVSRVGDDALGHAALEQLAEAGVDTRFVGRDPSRPTGSVDVSYDQAGEPQYRIRDQAAWEAIEISDRLLDELRHAGAFVFGSLAQRTPLNRDALRRAVHALPAGCPRICDLNLRPPLATLDLAREMLALCSIAKLNQHEHARLAELSGFDHVSHWMLETFGLSAVVVTLGDQGAQLSDQSGTLKLPAPEIASRTSDPVGAGDAFTSVLALGAQLSPRSLLSAANLYASFVASQPGAMPRAPRELRHALGVQLGLLGDRAPC